MEKIILKIREIIASKFWGTVTIKFQNGLPVTIETIKTEKL